MLRCRLNATPSHARATILSGLLTPSVIVNVHVPNARPRHQGWSLKLNDATLVPESAARTTPPLMCATLAPSANTHPVHTRGLSRILLRRCRPLWFSRIAGKKELTSSPVASNTFHVLPFSYYSKYVLVVGVAQRKSKGWPHLTALRGAYRLTGRSVDNGTAFVDADVSIKGQRREQRDLVPRIGHLHSLPVVERAPPA